MNDLQERLLQAHVEGDKAGLVRLYAEAADSTDDTDTRCFFLTHAYIFALEINDPETSTLYTRLKAFDRV